MRQELSAAAAVEAGRERHSSAGSSVSSGRSPRPFAGGEHSVILRRADRRRSGVAAANASRRGFSWEERFDSAEPGHRL